MALHLDPSPQVWGITGNLGGGKTLSAVSLASYGLAHGYYIVSNVSLKMDALALVHGEYVRQLYYHFSFEDPNFDPFTLPTGSPRGTANPKRVLVIMDECAEWIDQYTSANSDPRIKRFLSWLRHSSKRNQDVILIVQRLDYLNKNIRLLISKWLIVDDLRVWRVPIIRMPVPFMGNWCMQRVFDRTKRLVQGPCLCHKPTIGAFYNTAECLNSDGAQYNFEYQLPSRATNYHLFAWLVLWLASLVMFLTVCGLASDRHGRQEDNVRKVIRAYQHDKLSYSK